MKPRKTIGIYITADRAHLVCLKRTISGQSIQCEGSFSLSAREIGRFIRKAGFSGASAFVAVSRDQALTLLADLPAATEENLGETIGFELDRLTPFSAEEALFSYRIAGRDEERGTISVYLSVLPKSVFERYRGLLEELPAVAVHLEISDSALARAAMQIALDSCKDTYIVSAGKESALVVATSCGEVVCSRVVALAGDDRGEALDSELRNIAASSGVHLEKICFFGESCHAKKTAGWEASTAAVPVPVETGVLDPALRSIAYGAALGAAKVELETGTNLLREAGFKSRAASSWGTATAALAALVCVLAIAVLFTPFIRAHIRHNRVERELEALRPSVEKIEKIKKKTAALTTQRVRLERLGGGEHVVMGLLRELVVKLPEDTWLTEFSFDGKTIKIGGLSGTSSSLISLLEESSLIEKVEFSSSITMTDGSSGLISPSIGLPGGQSGRLERFTIKATLEGSI